MPVAQVTVLFVDQPKPGKKKGTIKTDTLDRIYVWPDKLNLFERGKVYTIEYDESDYQGRPFRNFKRIVDQGGQQRAEAPSPRTSTTSIQPKRATDDKTSKNIFVTGVVQRMVENGSYGPKDIDALTAAACAAWENHLGDNPVPRPTPSPGYDPNLDDEIPF